MTLWDAATIAQGAAVVAAFALARRRPDFWPIALYLAAVAAASLVRAALVGFVLVPERARMVAAGIDPVVVPFTSSGALAAVAADGSLWLLAPAGLAAVAAAVCLPRRRPVLVAIVVAWAVASVALYAAYPSPLVRGAGLARVYLAAELVGLAVAVACVAKWIGRVERPRVTHTAIFLCIAIVFAELAAGPWRRGDIFQRWYLANVGQVMLFVTLFVMEVWTWTRGSSSSSKPGS